MALWLSLDIVREEWPDALVSDEWLTSILETAQEQILEYAPASLTSKLDTLNLPIALTSTDPYTESDDSAAFPPRIRSALLMQAREIWRAAEREGDVLGVGEYTVRASDMTTTVRKILRPRRAYPIVR